MWDGVVPITGAGNSCKKHMTVKILTYNNTIHFNKNNLKDHTCIKTNKKNISVNAQTFKATPSRVLLN